MRTLTQLDLIVIAVYLLLIFAAGILLTRRASSSIDDFFIGGRHMPWWLIGISMAATNFSIDTPVSLTNFIRTEGISGVWFFWASAISALLVAFLFAKLWRRSSVMTDAEIIEKRYSGKPAAALRLFKGFYFGILFNAFIMGWVFLAVIKVLGGLTDFPVEWILFGATTLALIYTLASGFYGVVITDFIQYFVALAGSITLAVFAVNEVGGLGALVAGLEQQGMEQKLHFVPDMNRDNLGPISVFLTYIMVQWWAHKYADGGGKHIQRMLSAKNEQHAFAATLLYAFINYAVQVWPWILTALASLLLFDQLVDHELAYSMTMARVLPAGLLGLVLASLIGAFMSTIDTHLNLGASYMINDIYRRFIKPDASEKHYVWMSRLAMILLLAISIMLALNMESVAGAWKFLLTFAAGAGPVWIIRWYWWRINAWSEFSAMIASGIIATWINFAHGDWLYSQKLLLTVALTALIWIPVTLLTAPVMREKLQEFSDSIRPGGAGWREFSNLNDGKPGQALLHWFLALIALFGVNFGLGWLLLRSF
ncbi:MAG: SSS family solute:Na+ symporter [Lysobacterales bacterium]|jgi:SSS family solute:Na+ symporter